MGNAIIAALSGLLGVLFGGWISSKNQAKERKHNRIREQIDNFYGPLLGFRAQILAKAEVRLKIHGATGKAWVELMSRFNKPEQKEKISEERFPDFNKVIESDDRQFIDEIMPLYRQMVKHFADNMAIAQPTTREHFGALVEFVEIWNRWLDKTIPPESLGFLGHSEDKLKPFYKDLAEHLHSLTHELKS